MLWMNVRATPVLMELLVWMTSTPTHALASQATPESRAQQAPMHTVYMCLLKADWSRCKRNCFGDEFEVIV